MLTHSHFYIIVKHIIITYCFIVDLMQHSGAYPMSFRKPFNGAEIALLLLYSFVLVTGSIGNGMVIKTFLASSDKPGSRFVICLAIIDLISSVWIPVRNMIPAIQQYPHWPFGKIACRVLTPLGMCFIYTSAWLLVGISFERLR